MSTPSAPFEPLHIRGDSITLETDGKVLVLPTGNPDILPLWNETVLSSNRLTVEESPFGGLKGSGSPDYAPGTLFCQTDGVYLTDTSGTNSTKTLTAGKLKELSLLTVDTAAHSITEEFIVANTSESNNPTVIDDCSSATGWSFLHGSGDITVESGRIKVAGTSDSSGYLTIQKTVTLNLSAYTIFGCLLESNVAGSAYIQIKTGTPYKVWDSATRFILALNTNTRFFLPLLAPQGTTGQNPSTVSGTFALASTSLIAVGVKIGNSAACTFYVDDITADTAKPAYVELQVPDNLSDSSLQLQVFDGSAYQTTGVYKLDSTYSAVSTTTENWKLADGTKFDDCYGSGNGRSLFPKGASAETKAGSSGSITYSANKGTSKRIGFRVDLPPSDGGRTNFNKCRMKAILSYTDTVGNIVPDLSGNGNHGSIVGGVTKLNDGGLQFDGGTGKVSLPTSASLRDFTSKSVSFWFKAPGFTGTGRTIYDGGYWSSPFGDLIQMHATANNAIIYIKNTNGTTINRSVAFIPDFWNHLVYTWDGNTANFYMNNTVAQPLSISGTLACSSYTQTNGMNNSGSVPYNGSIRSFRVYNRALLAEEVTALYANQPITNGLVLSYNCTVQNMGSTTHDFADSTNTSYGLQNLSKPWIALYSPTDSLIDFYLFTHRPKNLSFKRNDDGTIHEVTLYPGNGLIYHGQITYANLTADSNSDGIPDCLEASVEGSLTKFLQAYGMVI